MPMMKERTVSTSTTTVRGKTIAHLAVAAVISGISLPSLAQQTESFGDMFSSAVSETSVDLSLRNFYFNRDFQDKRLDSSNKLPGTAEAWAQAARLDLSSGYFADIIGFDASWFGNLKLIGDDNKFGSGTLRENPKPPKNGKVLKDQESYNKLGQAFLKARFGDERLNANLKAGRMFIDTPLLNDSDSRATPSTTQGLYGEIEAYGLNLYGIYSDKASNKTESGFHSYKNDKGDWNVGILGATFSLENGLALHAATGKADKYLKQNYLNASYTLDMGSATSLLLDGYYQTSKDDGRYYDDELDTKLWNLASRLSIGDLSFLVSHQRVSGEAFVSEWGGSDANGLVTWNSVQYLDFNRKNEKSWQARVDYAFDSFGIPGLKLMTRYVKGEYKDNKKLNEWERDTNISYTFNNGSLDGLEITLRNATVRSAEKGNSVNENRLIVNYTLPII